jgi:DNA-binding PadR family transcriptional regulator
MDLLTRIEETILLAIYHLGEAAYGVTIRQQVEDMAQRSVSVGAIYVPLDRLTQRGLLATVTGEPTPERGGRRKRYYRLTPDGLAALEAVRQFHQSIWQGVPQLGNN